MNEKIHNCHKCGGSALIMSEFRTDLRKLCRKLEKGVDDVQASIIKTQIADIKEKIKKQKEWQREHLDEVSYSPRAS